jgi:Meiotically up-regulated gene 113
MIYFAQLPSGAIKIGFSSQVDARLEYLEMELGQTLTLLKTIPGDRSVERKIHKRFTHLRVGRTEQFKPGDDLLEFIARPVLVGMNPSTVEAPRRFGTLVRIADDVASDAKSVAALRGTSMAEYLSETLRPILKQTIIDELSKRKGGAK